MGSPVLIGYIRVSQVSGRSGDRFQSPGAQREAIEAWAKINGVKIGRFIEDLDKSGGNMERPGMKLALEEVRAGRAGGIVVARLDRFARNLVDGIMTIDELANQGARVVSVNEQIDPSTPTGRLMLNVLLSIAQWYRDAADEQIGSAQRRAADQGRFPGAIPYGYKRLEDGSVQVDKPAARIVKKIFELRAKGEGWINISRALDGTPSPSGRQHWATSTIQSIVKSRGVLGVFTGPRGMVIEDAWPPIIKADLWQRANAHSGQPPQIVTNHDRLFAGLVRCAGCRHAMARHVTQYGTVSYACRFTGCTAKATIVAERLDDYVSGLIDEKLSGLVFDPESAEDTTGLRAARDQAIEELESWRDNLTLRRELGSADWEAGLIARARERDRLVAEVAAAEPALAAVLPAGITRQLSELSWEARRTLVKTALHSVWVRRSEKRGPKQPHPRLRTHVVWADDPEPPELHAARGRALGPYPLPGK